MNDNDGASIRLILLALKDRLLQEMESLRPGVADGFSFVMPEDPDAICGDVNSEEFKNAQIMRLGIAGGFGLAADIIQKAVDAAGLEVKGQ